MVVYQVTITLQTSAEADWLDWMQRVHIPDVLNTGCFTRCTLARALELPGDEVTYVLRYDCPSQEDYERYREQFAPLIQQEHTVRYAGRFRGSRLLLSDMATLSR